MASAINSTREDNRRALDNHRSVRVSHASGSAAVPFSAAWFCAEDMQKSEDEIHRLQTEECAGFLAQPRLLKSRN